mmetsp:Transcript_10581/g.16927  ORF Transcript_10581/g.16927 Transcript_10581/m.16927 type:complete len:210 (-) Transcript_10581:838-1467(-)
MVQRLKHGVGTFGLNADHLDVGADGLDVRRDAGDEPAAPHGNKDDLHAGQLPHHLHAHRALPRHDERVVERRNEGALLLLASRLGIRLRGVVVLPLQHHCGAQRAHCVHLDRRRGDWHDDDGVALQLLRRQRNPLRVVPRRAADDPTGQRLGRQLYHAVVSAAQLEGLHRLQIFTLEVDLSAHQLTQPRREIQRGLDSHVVHVGGEDGS